MTALPNNDRFVQLVTSAGIVALPYDFWIARAADLAVWRIRGGVATKLTLTTHYTVSGAGNLAGGTATLATPAQAGDGYVLAGAWQIAQVLDLVAAGDFHAADLDHQHRLILAAEMELQRDLGRALQAPIYDPAGPYKAGSRGVDGIKYLEIEEGIVAPPAVDRLRLYAKDVGGITKLFARTGTADIDLTTTAADAASAIASAAAAAAAAAAAGIEALALPPMDGQCVILDVTPSLSRWLAGLIYDDAEDRFVWLEALGEGHDPQAGMIVARQTDDGFDSAQGLKTVFARASDPEINASAIGDMGSGWWGGVVVTGAPGSGKVFGLRSNDKFQTVDVLDMTSSTTLGDHFVYGQLLPWPAVAGGNDTTGWQVLSYSGTNDIKVLRTPDCGASWSDAVLKASAGLPGTAQEPSMVRLPDGRWLMLVRTAANTNAWAAVADAAMTGWSNWVDTGIPLGANPIHVLVDDDHVHAHVFYREDFPGAAEENCLVAWSAPAAAVGDDPATLASGARRILSTLPNRAVGYACSAQRGSGGFWYHLFKVGEGPSTLGGSGSALAAIRQLPGAVRGLMVEHRSRQYLDNPALTEWPRGTAVATSGVTEILTAGRWVATPSGSAHLEAERVEIPDNVRRVLPFRTAYGLKLSNPGGSENFVGLLQRWLGADAPRRVAELMDRQQLWLRLYGWGAFPAGWRAGLAFQSVNALRAGLSLNFPPPQGIEGLAPWATELELRTMSLAEMGLSLSSITSAFLATDNGAVASEFEVYLAGMFLLDGPSPPLSPPLPDDDDTEKAVRRYFRRVGTSASSSLGSGVARSSGLAWIHLDYEPMVVAPTLSVSDPTDFHLRDASDHVASAISGVCQASGGGRLAVTAAGIALGNACTLETVTSPPSGAPWLDLWCAG